MNKSLIIISEQNNLHQVEHLIDEVSQELNLGSELYGNVLISIIEATNNAMMHGNKMNASKKVYLNFRTKESSLIVCIEDEGDGFDYSNIPDPTSPENLEKISGRGVFLMKKLSDKVEFSNEGRKVEIYFNLK